MIKTLANTSVELTSEGAAWFPDHRILCIADIHFAKGSFFSKFATFLPPHDSEQDLEKIERLIKRFRPRLFIALGDSFHDGGAAQRLPAPTRDRLNRIIRETAEWVWITGNHDPQIAASIEGTRSPHLTEGGIVFRHETERGTLLPEVSGHFHPKASIWIRGHHFKGRCFVRKHDRLMLPSFGGYTGGLDIHDPAFLSVMGNPARLVYLIHGENLYEVE